MYAGSLQQQPGGMTQSSHDSGDGVAGMLWLSSGMDADVGVLLMK